MSNFGQKLSVCMKKNSAFTLIELAVVALVFLAMFAALAPFVRMAKIRANRMYCANNLRQISLCLHKYALEHGNVFPESLKDLYPNYITDQSVFDCPASKAVGTSDDPEYVYIAGLTEASSPKEIIVQDKDGSHKKQGKNTLRIDGAVEWAKDKR